MDAQLTVWDRSLIAARWCRDKAAGFIASFWLYSILWTVVGIAFGVLLYIDGKFSRGLAEGLEEIDPVSFQAMGWAYRLFAVVFLMAAARCIYKGVKGALTFRLLGVFASVIVCLHAFGFGFQALSDRRDDAMATREVVQLQADNSAEQIALLTGQIDRIRADRDAQVSRLQASIDGIVNDGLNNDYLADAYRIDQTRVEDAASASIASLEAQITTLATSGNEARQSVTTTLAEAKPWPALYVGLAQLITWSKEPTDWAIYLCGVGFIVAWVLLAESLVIFLPERIYLMHLRDADRPHEVRYSDDIPDGMTRWEGTAEEWDEIEAALKAHRNIKAGAKKGARTKRLGNKIEAESEYYRQRISMFMDEHNRGLSTSEIAAKHGMTVAVMRMSYGPYMNIEEKAALFGPPKAEAEPDVDPDLDIPPDPKDYPVEPYDPDRKPDGAE
jgi:hypothetical protein